MPEFEKIRPGMFVGLETGSNDPIVAENLRGWIAAYGPGPFFVRAKTSPEHVVLEDRNGTIIHFGGADPQFHIGHLRSWNE